MTGEGSHADHDATPKRDAAPADSGTSSPESEPSDLPPLSALAWSESPAAEDISQGTAASETDSVDPAGKDTEPGDKGADPTGAAGVAPNPGTDSPDGGRAGHRDSAADSDTSEGGAAGDAAPPPDAAPLTAATTADTTGKPPVGGADETPATDDDASARPRKRRGARIAAAPAAAGRRVRAAVTGVGNGIRSGRASIRRSFTLAGDRVLRRSETVNDRAAVLALVVFGLGIFALLVGFTTKWTVYGVAVTFFDGQSVSIALMITAALIAGTALLTGRYHLLALAPTFSAAALVVLAAELIEGPLGSVHVTVGFGGYTALIVGLVQCVVGTYATGAANLPAARFFVPVADSDTATSRRSGRRASLPSRPADVDVDVAATPLSLGEVVAMPAWETDDEASRREPAARSYGGAATPAGIRRGRAVPATTAAPGSTDPSARRGRPTDSGPAGSPADRYPVGEAPPSDTERSDDDRRQDERRQDDPTGNDPTREHRNGRDGAHPTGDPSTGGQRDGDTNNREPELVGYGAAANGRSARELDAAGIDVPRYLGPPRGSPQSNYPLPGGDGGRRPTRPQYRYGASMGATPYRRPRNPAEAYPVIGDESRPARPNPPGRPPAAPPEPVAEPPAVGRVGEPAPETPPALERRRGVEPRPETPPELGRADIAENPDAAPAPRDPEPPPSEEPPTLGRSPE